MGRFISPDPSGLYYADPTNPQSLNLYSYALNNPLKFVDPTGLVLCDYGSNDSGGEDYEDADDAHECTSNGGTVSKVNATVPVNGDTNDSSVVVTFIPGDGQSIPVPYTPNRSGFESLFCLGDAIKKNGVSLALDAASIAAGALPGGATTAGLVKAGVTAGIGNLSAAYSAATSPNLATGASQFVLGFTGTAASTIGILDSALNGAAALKAVPFWGSAISLFSTGVDVTKTFMDQSACVDSGKYD